MGLVALQPVFQSVSALLHPTFEGGVLAEQHSIANQLLAGDCHERGTGAGQGENGSSHGIENRYNTVEGESRKIRGFANLQRSDFVRDAERLRATQGGKGQGAFRGELATVAMLGALKQRREARLLQ